MSQVVISVTDEDNYWVENYKKEIQIAIQRKQPFFVVGLNRDCDGTPLYSLSLFPMEKPSEHMISTFFTDVLELDNISSVRQYVGVSDVMGKFIINGISEKVLALYQAS